jgi:hypothetical protein
MTIVSFGTLAIGILEIAVSFYIFTISGSIEIVFAVFLLLDGSGSCGFIT